MYLVAETTLYIVHLSRSYLKALRQDVTQMVHSIMREKSIPAHQVMMDPELKELESNAHISVDSFVLWMEALLACLPENDADISVAEAVRNYVKAHIRENLSREMIAASLYMNADYLGKLYKRETGQALGNYIRDEKMNEACNMLALTSRSVGEICTELGYGNFSHFSKIFKQVTGYTSKEYRKLCRTGRMTAIDNEGSAGNRSYGQK